MSTHYRYDADGKFVGSSQNKGDRILNFDEYGRQTSTSWIQGDRIDTIGVGGELEHREWLHDGWTEDRGPQNEYLGYSRDAGSHRDYYDDTGTYDGSSDSSSW